MSTLVTLSSNMPGPYKMGSALKEKHMFPRGANSFPKEQTPLIRGWGSGRKGRGAGLYNNLEVPDYLFSI